MVDAGDTATSPSETAEFSPSPSPAAKNGGFLNRDHFISLANQRRRIEVIEIPEHGKVHVRALTASEKDSLEATFVKGRGMKQRVSTEDMRAKVIQRSLVNPDGTLMFAVTEIPLIGKLPAIVAEHIYEAAMRLTRIDRDSLEDLEGNSDNGQRDDS